MLYEAALVMETVSTLVDVSIGVYCLYVCVRVRFKVMMLVMEGEPGRGLACAVETSTNCVE